MCNQGTPDFRQCCSANPVLYLHIAHVSPLLLKLSHLLSNLGTEQQLHEIALIILSTFSSRSWLNVSDIPFISMHNS